MALVTTILKRNAQGVAPSRENRVKFTMDASYAAGGYAVAASDVGLATIDGIALDGPSAAGYFVTYVQSTGKLKVYTTAATEAANNLAGLNGDVVYGTAYGDQVNAG